MFEVSLFVIDKLAEIESNEFAQKLDLDEKLQVLNALMAKLYDYSKFIKEMVEVADDKYLHELAIHSAIERVFYVEDEEDEQISSKLKFSQSILTILSYFMCLEEETLDDMQNLYNKFGMF